jgi:hypothetical protein
MGCLMTKMQISIVEKLIKPQDFIAIFDNCTKPHNKYFSSPKSFREYTAFIDVQIASGLAPEINIIPGVNMTDRVYLHSRNSYGMDSLMQKYFTTQTQRYFKEHPEMVKHMLNVTNGQVMYINDELTYSISRHIVAEPASNKERQLINPYSPVAMFLEPRSYIIDNELLKKFGQRVCDRLDPISQDPKMIDALKTRFCRVFLAELATYPFDLFFTEICKSALRGDNY